MELPIEFKRDFSKLSKVQKKRKLEEYYNNQKRWNSSSKDTFSFLITTGLAYRILYSTRNLFFNLINELFGTSHTEKNTPMEKHLAEVKQEREDWVNSQLKNL